MERKIREDFGGEEGESVRKRRRFWTFISRTSEDGAETVPMFAIMPNLDGQGVLDLETWPAGEMVHVVLPEETRDGERGQKRGRRRAESLDSETSQGVSLFSFGSFGSRTSQGSHTGGMLRWARGLFGQSSQRVVRLD